MMAPERTRVTCASTRWDGTAWTQLGSDIDGEAAGDNFGFSVSINSAGDRVAIGGPENDESAGSTGPESCAKSTRTLTDDADSAWNTNIR